MIVPYDTVSSVTAVVTALTGICGSKYVLTDTDDLYNYERDQTTDLHCPFDILVKPADAEEIAEVLKVCNRYNIYVTPRGAGSGVTGGALAVKKGVVLSLERLNRIISFNKIDGYIIAEAGVITADLCTLVEEEGFYFPAAPSSSAYSFIGGNVAENAGSINSCRYGTTAQYVLNLEVVLPTGEIIWTGANVMKNVTGLNLTQLFVGSEGILGIITKVAYRLIHKPAHEVSLLAVFNRLNDAFDTVTAIKRSGLHPSAVELIGPDALNVTVAYLEESLQENIQAHLLINLQEDTAAGLENTMIQAASVIEKYTKEPILTAFTSAEKDKLWKIRFNIGAALTSRNRKYRDIDICMPLSVLHEYVKEVEEICTHYHIPVAWFGHALDGNLHTMLMLGENGQTENDTRVKKAIHEIYTYAIGNGGVISGEHGIGMLQKEFMPLQFSRPHLDLMQGIKHLFDPNDILNPGKIL